MVFSGYNYSLSYNHCNPFSKSQLGILSDKMKLSLTICLNSSVILRFNTFWNMSLLLRKTSFLLIIAEFSKPEVYKILPIWLLQSIKSTTVQAETFLGIMSSSYVVLTWLIPKNKGWVIPGEWSHNCVFIAPPECSSPLQTVSS